MSMLVSNNIPNSIVDVATAGKDGVYGVVKISDDGSLSITEDGVLSQTAEFVTADPSTTPPTPGLVKVDGVTIKIGSNGIISGASAMNIATPNTAGTVMPDGKSIKILPDGTIYTDGKPPVATTSRLGTVKPDGSSIKVDNDGTLHAEVDTSNLPIFKAETITDKGVNGVVPRPTTKNVDEYLCADGTWGKIEVNPPQAIKDKIEQLITDEKTATLSKDAELNKAVDDIPTGYKTTIAVGDMTSFTAKVGGVLKIKLNFVAPSVMSVTTTLNKEAVVMRAGGVMIRRSTTEYPKTIKDGDLVIDAKSADFSKYETTGYVDDNNIVDGTIYYYTAFPYTSDGVYNESGNATNHATVKGKKGEVYGYDIHQPDDNPDHRVSYPSDVMNATWDPISITLDSDNYNLGKWANTFFMEGIRPVMLKYDGTVDYELDHNDQTKKLDGTASDISNENYQGNAMVEIPKMYFARWTDANGEWSHVRISDIDLGDIIDTSTGKILASYHCYAHITNYDNGGATIPFEYNSFTMFGNSAQSLLYTQYTSVVSGSGSWNVLVTKVKYDLTNISNITIKDVIRTGSLINATCLVASQTDYTSWNMDSLRNGSGFAKIAITDASGNLTLDVSSLTGDYYIGIYCDTTRVVDATYVSVPYGLFLS